MKLYEKLYQPEALNKAFNRAMCGHRNETEHAMYETNKIEVIDFISSSLINKSYIPQPLRLFEVFEPKRRFVQAPSVMDKIVQNALMDEILYDVLTKPFIRDSYSGVKGSGTHDGLNRLKQFMTEAWRKYGTDCWVLKGDIHHFFDSINQDDVMRRASRYINDSDVINLLWRYIRLCPHGLPLGLRTSQPLANLELCWMDHMIKEKYRCQWYGRYMDDFYVIHPDKQFLKQLRRDLEAELAVIGLKLNNKTQIFPVRHGIDFLGFRTYTSDSGKIIRQLRRQNKKNIARKIRHYAQEYREGKLSADKLQQQYKSWRAHAGHGSCRSLIMAHDAEIKNILKGGMTNESADYQSRQG